jgi:hypothetical protein
MGGRVEFNFEGEVCTEPKIDDTKGHERVSLWAKTTGWDREARQETEPQFFKFEFAGGQAINLIRRGIRIGSALVASGPVTSSTVVANGKKSVVLSLTPRMSNVYGFLSTKSGEKKAQKDDDFPAEAPRAPRAPAPKAKPVEEPPPSPVADEEVDAFVEDTF